MVRKALVALCAVLALVASTVASGAPAEAHSRPPRHRPVVFVHGFVGSGGQFETQAMRFTSNGYRSSEIGVLEYDSLFASKPMAEVWNDLDVVIDELLADSGADQVDLLGHSLGTSVSYQYLTSSPERAARVARYVNLDGFPAPAPPAGIPTLAVWGEGNEGADFGGATNVHLSDQSHVQVATSAETFDATYRFLNDRAPSTTGIVVQHFVRISGKAVLFPSNAGVGGATVEVWEVDGRTGERRGHRPKATFTPEADGSWGPFWASSRRYYELTVSREGQAHHFYQGRFPRSDHLVRLLTQDPGTGLDALREKSDTTTSFTVLRYKEFWGDQGEGSDVLEIDGQNILAPAVAPRAKRLIALFAFDAGLDGVTDLSAPIPAFAGLPFISGADTYLPATAPPSRSIELRLTPRGGDGTDEVINVPNRPSSTDHNSVRFQDFTDQELVGPGHGHRETDE